MRTRLLPGISHKITAAYYVVALILIFFAGLTVLEIRFIEEKMMVGEDIAELLNTTLEVRRFEKNYFLYHQRDDLVEHRAYLHRAIKLISKNESSFGSVATEEQLQGLKRDLVAYMGLMVDYERWIGSEGAIGHAKNPAERIRLESSIRATGKNITTVVEGMSKIEQTRLRDLLRGSVRILILIVGALTLGGIGVAHLLSRKVVRPLKQLESRMRLIAQGRFESVRIDSDDREILSLTAAFDRMLKELDVRQRHLVRTEKLASLGILLSGVAHELNNPLSNISSSAEILKEELAGEDRQLKEDMLDQIESQTDRARAIVRSLLDFSRDRIFQKEWVSVLPLVEETLRFVGGQRPANISVKTDIPPGLMVLADRQKLQQALLNLLKNAIEAVASQTGQSQLENSEIDRSEHKQSSGWVFLKARECSEGEGLEMEDFVSAGKIPDGPGVQIEVTDTGEGISADILPRIFDPFFTTKDVGKGSGLGLFIVHEIIEQHEGYLGVRSQAGKGTTFLIRLPAAGRTE